MHPGFIRKLYRPGQPTIRESDGQVKYFETLPDISLQPFIYCYWELKTDQQLSGEFNYRVVADGCIDIFFELNNAKDNYVMGFCKHYTEFVLGNSFHYVGIRFLPSMFPQIFNINAAELSNRFEHLGIVVPGVSGFIGDHFFSGQTTEEITTRLDKYFIGLIHKLSFEFDNRLYETLEIILKNSGVIQVEKDLNTGISPRQLRRLFGFYIGDTAKTFCKVVRFQHILQAKPSTESLRRNKLFFDAGYHDQAHFIKEFRNLYGVTPSKAFGR